MKRLVVASVVLFALVFMGGRAAGQPGPKKEDDKKAKSPTRATALLQNLRMELDMSKFTNPMPFKEFLDLLQEFGESRGVSLPFVVDFRALGDDREAVMQQPIQFPRFPKKMTVAQAVAGALKQLPMATRATYLVRGGQIEITTQDVASKEVLLNQTFFADFDGRPLDQVLDDLTDLTGVSIVLDGRARERAKAAVTARFRNDVAVQDAVRLLAEMAELKLLHLPTGLFVTTPAHAQMFQKELRDIYAPPATPGVPGGLAAPPEVSPLYPPPPPSRREAAAS